MLQLYHGQLNDDFLNPNEIKKIFKSKKNEKLPPYFILNFNSFE